MALLTHLCQWDPGGHMVGQLAQLGACLEEQLLLGGAAVAGALQAGLQVQSGLNSAESGNLTPLSAHAP